MGTVGYAVRTAQQVEIPLDETTETHEAPAVWSTPSVAVESALRILGSIPGSQDDVRHARESAERLVGLVDSTLVQVGSLPGAKLVRRRMNRVPGGGGPASLVP